MLFSLNLVLFFSCVSISMGKLLLINSNRSGDETVRIKLDENVELVTYNDLKIFICSHLSIDKNLISMEVLDPLEGLYSPVILSATPSFSSHLSVLLVHPNCGSKDGDTLQIQGRHFDCALGLPLNNSTIRVSEPSQAALGTGLNTWDGSFVLAKFLETNPALVRGKRVLELGAGTGVAGIAACLLGAAPVLVTDLEYALDNLRENVRTNVGSGDCQVGLLDWADQDTFPTQGEEWEVLLGADVVWLEELVPLLLKALDACMGGKSVFYLAHQKRSERTDKLLFDGLSSLFLVNKISEQLLHPEFRSPKINIWEVRRP